MDFEPLSTLKNQMRYGMSYMNLLILDACLTTHIATYNFEKEIFVNFHTQKEITLPVMWCNLPTFNEGVFSALVDQL